MTESCQAIKGSALLALVMTMIPGARTWDKKDAPEEARRLHAAATVLDEIMATPDKGISKEVLASEKCVAVVPSMLKAASSWARATARVLPLAALVPAGALRRPSALREGALAFKSGEKRWIW